MDLDVLFYKWFLMILGGIIAVGSFVFMILMVLAGIWIGAALMLFCSLMGAGTFYTVGIRAGTARKSKKPLT